LDDFMKGKRPKQTSASSGERGVFKRDDKWWVCYADASGRIHRESVGSKTMARNVYQLRKTQIREGKFFPELIRNPGPTFAEVIDDFIETHEARWKAAAEWKRLGGKLKLQFQGRIRQLSRAQIQRWVDLRAAKVKPGTVNRSLTLLKSCLQNAVANGVLNENPARFVKKLPEHNERMRFLSADEETRLFDELPEKYHPLFHVALLTGLRRGEIFGLEWRDLDFENGFLTVRDPKEGKTKRLPISEHVRSLLLAVPRDGVRVFPWNAHNFERRVFLPAVRHAEIQDFRFHDARHTFASRLAMAGVDLLTIGKLMGHSGTRMTERYAHLCQSHLRSAVEKLTGTATDTAKSEDQESQWAVQVSNLRPPACKLCSGQKTPMRLRIIR